MSARLRAMTGDLVEERRVPKKRYHIYARVLFDGTPAARRVAWCNADPKVAMMIDDIPTTVTTRPEYVCEKCWLEFVKVTP